MTCRTTSDAVTLLSRTSETTIFHRTVRRVAKNAVSGITLALAVASQALAQQPPAAPEQHETASTPAKPDAAPGGQPGPPAQLSFSPWTKFCFKGAPGMPAGPDAKEICFTGTDASLPAAGGQRVAVAMLLEPADGSKKLLRITFPLAMRISEGTRVILDQDTPIASPYRTCVAGGCMSDYEASPELIARLKADQSLRVEAISDAGTPISVVLPLNGFAKAYDGPPADPQKEPVQKSP